MQIAWGRKGRARKKGVASGTAGLPSVMVGAASGRGARTERRQPAGAGDPSGRAGAPRRHASSRTATQAMAVAAQALQIHGTTWPGR